MYSINHRKRNQKYIQDNFYVDYVNLNESDLGSKYEKTKFYIFKTHGSVQDNIICNVCYELNTTIEEELTSFSGLTDKTTSESFTTTHVDVFEKTLNLIRNRENFVPDHISRKDFYEEICRILELKIKSLMKL
tara:strand:+ start:11004 stop:11402 length:399 start_codon:yes stop_codon:yes gene_type:complete